MTLLALVLAAGIAHAEPPLQPRPEDAIAAWTAWVEYEAAIQGVPGVSLGVVHGQDTLLATGIGLADREHHVPARSATRYGICSISKLFTSIATLQLRDAGRLRLDDPVVKHVRWFDIPDPTTDDEPVTVWGLLTHSSGLPRETGLSYWGEPGFPFPTEEQLRAQIPKVQTLYPSERYSQYSNFGMAILGQVVAAAARKPYEEYVQERVLKPLGLSHTTTSLPVGDPDLAVGYSARRRDATRVAVDPYDARGMRSAFGYASNVDDLLAFLKWQLRLRDDGGEEVLSSATLREMQRVQWVDPGWQTTWGLGFWVGKAGNGTMIGHEGWCPGFRTAVHLDPDTDYGVVVLTNANDIDPVHLAGEGLQLLGMSAAGTAPRDPGLERYTGIYDEAPHGEMAIVRWGDGLGMLWLHTGDPSAEVLPFVKTDAPDTFLHRYDDGHLGESVVFRLGADGKVEALVVEDNVIPRTTDLRSAGP